MGVLMPAEFHTLISGDIAAASDVTVNVKGGSVTATLKKALRDKLRNIERGFAGAALQFADGNVLVLLGETGDEQAPGYKVRRLGPYRFELELEIEHDEEIGEVEAAFLRLKRNQFVHDRLDITAPVTAEEYEASVNQRLASVRAARMVASKQVVTSKLRAK